MAGQQINSPVAMLLAVFAYIVFIAASLGGLVYGIVNDEMAATVGSLVVLVFCLAGLAQMRSRYAHSRDGVVRSFSH